MNGTKTRTETGWNVGRLCISDVQIEVDYFYEYGTEFFQVRVQFIGPDALEPDSASQCGQIVQSQKIFHMGIPEAEAVQIVIREVFLHEIDEWLRNPKGQLVRVAHHETRLLADPILGFELNLGVK